MTVTHQLCPHWGAAPFQVLSDECWYRQKLVTKSPSTLDRIGCEIWACLVEKQVLFNELCVNRTGLSQLYKWFVESLFIFVRIWWVIFGVGYWILMEHVKIPIEGILKRLGEIEKKSYASVIPFAQIVHPVIFWSGLMTCKRCCHDSDPNFAPVMCGVSSQINSDGDRDRLLSFHRLWDRIGLNLEK
jgi:hypothetical protein